MYDRTFLAQTKGASEAHVLVENPSSGTYEPYKHARVLLIGSVGKTNLAVH